MSWLMGDMTGRKSNLPVAKNNFKNIIAGSGTNPGFVF